MAQCQAANKGLEESETTYTYLQAYKIFSLLLGGFEPATINIRSYRYTCILVVLCFDSTLKELYLVACN